MILAAVLPGARSVQLADAVTIFATLLNTGSTPLDGCRISLPSAAPSGLSLSYQTTDPATNSLTGTANTPSTIAGNDGVQSYLLTFHGTTPFSAPGMALDCICDSTPLAPYVLGVNSIDLVMSSTPIADIIALVATPTNNGIIEVPKDGAAAFAVASSNVGVTAALTVSVAIETL